MKASFVYMPVFRVRTQEIQILGKFEFDKEICPYIEIVKAMDRPREKFNYRTFNLAVLLSIKSDTVFVDIPIRLNLSNQTNQDVVTFLAPMRDVNNRIKALATFAPLPKMVPVISSYYTLTGVAGTIRKQVENLRPLFPRLAFRIIAKDPEFESELDQVEPWLTAADHLIVDFGEDGIDYYSKHIAELKNRLANISVCPVVVLRSAIPNNVKYKDFENDEEVPGSDNQLKSQYKLLHASAFGDYAGIKRDLLTKAGGGKNTIYGCILYDSTENKYYGYKASGPGYGELKRTVIPSVLQSDAVKRMKADDLEFICDINKGWKLLQQLGPVQPGQLKRVSMEHYLHCIKTLIKAGRMG